MRPVLAIALFTMKAARRDWAVVSIAILAPLAVAAAYLLAMFSFGEKARTVLDMGAATATLAGFLLVSLAASLSIPEDRERRRTQFLLSKPVGRSEYLFGRALGVVGAVTLAGLPAALATIVAHHLAIADDLNRSPAALFSGALWEAWGRPGLGMALSVLAASWLQAACLAAFATASALFVPRAAFLPVAAGGFVLGNLVDFLMASAPDGVPRLVARAAALPIPPLSRIEILGQAVRAHGVPWEALGAASLEALLFCAFALAVASVRLSRMDLE
ncbi:MAG: ABC transporter permease subunit [Planctomycetota bacterium]